MFNHYIKACIHIPDKIKNRLIIKHNSNPRTKTKLPLVETVIKENKIITNNPNNSHNTNNVIGNTLNTNSHNNTVNNIQNNNNSFILNPFGKETLDHISDEDLNEIISSPDNIIGLFKEKLDLIPENNNSYVDTRRSLAFYHDKENNIKIDRLHDYLVKFCDMYMEVLKKMTEDTPERFNRIKKLVFEDTYNIYFCVINKDNFDDMEYIEQKHRELTSIFNAKLKVALLNSNMKSKANLTNISKDFNKIC
jgi:hypothetical protein